MHETGLTPRWASAPGATISSALSERNITTAHFAAMIDMTHREAEQLLEGELAITVSLARRLSEVVGASSTFWLTREAQYVEDRARVEADRWAQRLPVSQMASFGWIEKPQTWQEQIEVCLDFFDVPDVNAWEERYDQEVIATHYRTSPTFDLDLAVTTAWFRAAERLVEKQAALPTFDKVAFGAALPAIRRLSRERDPEKFIPELVGTSARCGVHVAVLPAPKGCPASGAARSYRGRPLIQLSARYLSDDHFWFTFFHEAGHILNHRLEHGFIDTFEGVEGDNLEDEADDFASECLLGPHGSELRRRKVGLWSHREVIRVAQTLEISPGTLVGQLQHSGAVPVNHLNRLKRRYQWNDNRLVVDDHSR